MAEGADALVARRLLRATPMKMTRRSGTQSGFTLIELMIVVAIIGILAAVAVPAFMEYMSKGKRSEGDLAVNLIKKNALTYYSENNRYPTVAAGPLPDATSCDNPRKVFDHRAVTWTGGLAELGFTMASEFRYDFTYTPGATDQTFTFIAHGDLDCDGGTANTLTLTANVDTTGAPTWELARSNAD